MNKFSNLYDIDGNIINKSPQHTFTLDEVEELVDNLTRKVEANPENKVYKVYLNNAQRWLMHMYDHMSREELIKRMSFMQAGIDKAKEELNDAEKEKLEEINKIVDNLKEAYDKENETVMEEYVEPIEEVS